MEIWLGEAGSGKTTAVCRAVADAQSSAPEGPPIFIITPDQATFVVEQRLLTSVREGVLLRAQVHHLRRIATLILKAESKLPATLISPAGKYALFTRCVQEVKHKLTVFADSVNDFSYQQRLLSLIEELQQSGIEITSREFLQTAPISESLQAKLQDLTLLWQHYEEQIAERFMDPYHLLPEFVRYIEEHPAIIAGWSIYVDGFLGFTGQEWQVIEALAKHAGKFVMTIGLPPEWAEYPASELALNTEFSPFAQAVEVLEKCRLIADRLRLPIQITAPPGYQKEIRFLRPELAYLAEHAFAAAPDPYVLQDFEMPCGLRMLVGATREEEIAGMVRDLFRQKDEGGFRFRDFAVIVTDMAAYRPLLVRHLQRAGIPYALDERTPLLHDPLPKLLLSLLGWLNQVEDEAFELLKSDLFVLSREEADELENLLLASGLTLTEWLDVSLSLQHKRQIGMQKRLRKLREPWEALLGKGPLPTERWLRQLWTTLEQIDHSSTLTAVETGTSKRQVLQLIVRIFDDLAVVLGERKITLTELIEYLKFSLEGASSGTIPILIDQVLVTEVSRVRAFEHEVVYLLGVNEGAFPVRASADELLGDQERIELLSTGLYIAADSVKRQQFERARMYMAITRARSQLVMSYATQADDGRALLPALFLRKLTRDFAGLQIADWSQPAGDFDAEALSYCQSIASAAEQLGQVISEQSSLAALPIVWQGVYQLFATGVWIAATVTPHLLGLLHHAKSQVLDAVSARLLYGDQLVGSISRLERFAACPFAYFVEYGLNARERELARLDHRQQGNLLHKVLERAQTLIMQGERDWSELTDAQVDELTEQVFSEEITQFAGGKLQFGGRNRLLAQQLLRTLQRTLRVFTEHARRGRFIPVQLEQKFEYEDPQGGFLLSGRIDRVDLAVAGTSAWFRIIDFKSSERNVDMAKIYYGLALQLLLYASVTEDLSDRLLGTGARFAGIFYFSVRDPVMSVDVPTPTVQVAAKIRKNTLLKGLFLAEPGVIRLFDEQIEEGATDLVPKLLNKNDTIAKRVPVIGVAAWQELKALGYRHVDTLTQQAATGNIRIEPYKLGKETPCGLCSLAAVCAFEARYDYPLYRRLPLLKREEVLEWLEDQAERGRAR